MWFPLDPFSTASLIRAVIINEYRRRPGVTNFDEEIWARIGLNADEDIASGKMRMEETAVSGIRVSGSSRAVSRHAYFIDQKSMELGMPPRRAIPSFGATNIRFVRFGRVMDQYRTLGMIANPIIARRLAIRIEI